MVIDSHQHFWAYDPEKHAWIDDSMQVIRRDFDAETLARVYKQYSIDGCIAVQADQTQSETNYLLDIAKNHDFIKGVVGWVDLAAIDIDQQLEKYSANPVIKGFRHVVQNEHDPLFMLQPDFMRGIKSLGRYQLSYDILIFPHQLGQALELVKQFPEQAFVIDHIAKPHIKAGLYDAWAVMMKAIAQYDNVYCKLSGMVTEAEFNSWTPQQIEPYIHLVLEAFGAHRVMFGSDWPVCLVAANYGQVKLLVTESIKLLSHDEQAAIMGGNATRFYRVE